MSVHHDLDQILGAMSDLESRINSLKIAILRNEDEIMTLLALQETLEENIIELKRKYVIAMAQEYKKAKEDLKRTGVRLTFLRMDKATYERAFTGHIEMLEFLKKEHDKTVERLKHNVIQGNFGRKNGG